MDVLERLDCVDNARIAMIGHSMGAGTTFWTMAFDDRIRAGVVSCHFLGGLGLKSWYQFYRQSGSGLFYHEMLALAAPRAVLATRGKRESSLAQRGDFETTKDENAVFQWCYEYGRHFSRLYDAPEDNIQARLFDGVHSFPDAERAYAYDWIDERVGHDGRLEDGTLLSPLNEFMQPQR